MTDEMSLDAPIRKLSKVWAWLTMLLSGSLGMLAVHAFLDRPHFFPGLLCGGLCGALVGRAAYALFQEDIGRSRP